MKNVSCRLWYLNTCFLMGDAVWRRFRWYSLAGRSTLLEQDLRIASSPYIQFALFAS